MNAVFVFLSVLLLKFLACSQAYAVLSWETTQITQKADHLSEAVVAVYRFENIGDDPVAITEIKSSCGCTTTELEKKTYAPGKRVKSRRR